MEFGLTQGFDARLELELPELLLPLPLPLLELLPLPLLELEPAMLAIWGLAAPPRLVSGASLERSGNMGTMGVCVQVPCGAGMLQFR